jgi:Cdc6-like AAA superfamily ATPase
VFTPTTPINASVLFAGRLDQVRDIVDAIHQKGQHAILFGERGVGKTSLANVLVDFLPRSSKEKLFLPRINCDAGDDYKSIWLKVFREVFVPQKGTGIGFQPIPGESQTSLADHLPERFGPDDVRRMLKWMSDGLQTILIFDEFDRLPKETTRGIADTIKSLSDHAVAATILLVGVGDSVEELIEGHRSVERALVQVHMPRMSREEIGEIIANGLTRLGLGITTAVRERIVQLSQGLPHYTHLLCLHACRECMDRSRTEIGEECLEGAIQKSLSRAQQSVRTQYHVATMSPRKDHLYNEVLLACALAGCDELGYFAATDVRQPLRDITAKSYEIPAYSRHMNEFCSDKRGSVLEKTGNTRRFRFRFTDPLLQPYVVMMGYAAGRLKNVAGWA